MIFTLCFEQLKWSGRIYIYIYAYGGEWVNNISLLSTAKYTCSVIWGGGGGRGGEQRISLAKVSGLTFFFIGKTDLKKEEILLS